MSRNYVINDFSGGVKGEHGTKRAQNQCADMINCWPQGINLRPMKSNDRMTNAASISSTDTNAAFTNHELYTDAEGNEFLVAKRNKTIWFGVKDTANWKSDSVISWYPLHGDVWQNSSLALLARGKADTWESFVQVGNMMYMASDDPIATDYLLKWDGFYYATGTLKYTGVDSAGHGIYASNDLTRDFEAAGVRVGDFIYFKDHSTGKWNIGTDSATHGYVIAGIDSNGGGSPGVDPSEPPTLGSYIRMSPAAGTRLSIADLQVGDDLGQPAGGQPNEDRYSYTGWMTLAGGPVISSIEAYNTTTGTALIYHNLGATVVTENWGNIYYSAAHPTTAFTMMAGYQFVDTNDADDYYNAVNATATWDGLGKLLVQTTSSTQCFDTTGKGASASDYVDYVIVRVQRAGLPIGVSCGASADVSTGLAAGSYTYRWRYYNSKTGFAGSLSVPSDTVTLAASGSIRVNGWDTAFAEPADVLQIFRSSGTSPYYLVKEYDRTATYGTNKFDLWAAYYVDDGWSPLTSNGVPIQAEADSALYTRPPVLRGLSLFNGRLYGFGYGDEAHYLKFSSLYQYDAWPVINWEYDITGTGLTIEGGVIPVGSNRREPLVAMVPEGGSYTTTGCVGSNLLLFTGKAAYRWYGVSWDDFNLVNAFQVGCVAQHSVVNANGNILFLNQNHLMALPSGGNDPTPVSLELWPCGIQTDFDAASDTSVLSKWRGCFWNQCYLMTGTIDGTYNDTVWILHLPTGAWFKSDACVNDMRVWDNPGSLDTLIISACESQLYSSDSKIVSMFSGLAASGVLYDSGPIRPQVDSKELFKGMKIKSITTCWHGASAPTTVNMAIYDSFKPEHIVNTVISVPNKSQDGRGYFTHIWSPSVMSLEPSLKIESSARHALRLEWIRIEFDSIVDGSGVR